MRIATSMTSLRVNVLETVLVPLITELLRLAKEHSAPALITNSIFPTNLQTTFFSDRYPGMYPSFPQKICEAPLRPEQR